MTQLFELRPNRSLLNPDFNGYKLSLEKIPVLKKEFNISVDRVLPNSEQYSLLHARLFGLHNHLFTDYIDNAVYFIDRLWNVQRVALNMVTGRLHDIKKVWQVPLRNDRKPGNYNISLHFISEDLTVLSDGAGTLHIIMTGNRSEGNMWQSIFSDEVLEAGQSFVIQDAIYKGNDNSKNELHCLLFDIDRNECSEKFSTVISWITLTENSNSQWGQVCLRVLKATGVFYYCTLEPNCKYIYIASDKQFKFTLDSENPISEESTEKQYTNAKIYTWVQNEDDITIRLNTNVNCSRSDFEIIAETSKIQIRYKNTILIDGDLAHRIDSDLTTWIIDNSILEIILIKVETGLMWQDLIPGDETGEQIINPNIIAEVHERLAHLCNETEVLPAESGTAVSSQQIEECDFDTDNTAIFERICSTSHAVTHRTNLGSHQVIMSVKLDAHLPSSLAVRHDVDACLWCPQEQSDGRWTLKHAGTLLAFGYVQASKQQRKFSSCSPDLNYSVICESNRHVFLYRQNKAVTSGELRNRRSGYRVGTVAEQQVMSLGDDEILGLSATNEILYLLTENYILALKIQCTEK